MADSLDVLRAGDNAVTNQHFEQQGHRLAMIGNWRGLLPFLILRFQGEPGIRQADTFNQPLTQQITLRHVQ